MAIGGSLDVWGGARMHKTLDMYNNYVSNVADGINSTDAVNVRQLRAVEAKIPTSTGTTDPNAVHYDGTTKTKATLAGTGGTTLANVKAGAQYDEAVNLGQLKAAGITVDGNGTPTNALTNVAPGAVSGSSKDAINGAQLFSNIDSRVYNNTQAIANNTTAISNLSTQISNGEVGLVKQDAASRQITVAKDNDGTSVNVAGTAGDRVVTGVAAAKADNDAVNLGQLKSAGVISANGEAKSVMTYDDAGKTSMTMGGEGATSAVTIHNVADGVADHDAVNVSQLNQRLQQNTTEVLVQANSYTDQKIDDVWNGMDKLATQVMKQDRSISQHGAMSMAQSQMASGAAAAAVGNPNGAWSVGLGSEQGYGAISAGYAKPVGKKSQISFGAAFSGDERSVGVGFAHKL